mmetsp:Transcript_6242/g.13602  ORF Transcript_6242/g.13602 Transcript_6242/m.13602 type:complete len:118 (-) Transcript_6242:1598-1951(-)
MVMFECHWGRSRKLTPIEKIPNNHEIAGQIIIILNISAVAPVSTCTRHTQFPQDILAMFHSILLSHEDTNIFPTFELDFTLIYPSNHDHSESPWKIHPTHARTIHQPQKIGNLMLHQ